MSDKRVCEVCGREKWAYSGPARNPDNCMIEFKWCPPADAAKHWERGYKRLAAILTPEVLRLIEAGREYQTVASDPAWRGTLTAMRRLERAALALPFEKPAESNHTEKQQLPKKGGET